MAKRYRISDIKAANEAAGRFFFSRSTLRFHKDRVSNWGVWHKGDRVLIHHKLTGQVREFFPATGEISVPLKEW